MHFLIENTSLLPKAAAWLLENHPNERIFAFYGPMGVGKTTFIKAICDLLKTQQTVNSPTFAIVNTYTTTKHGNIYHFDFYRVEKIEEIFDIGYETYFFSNNYCFIEWPEKAEILLPKEHLKVFIEENMDGSRTIKTL